MTKTFFALFLLLALAPAALAQPDVCPDIVSHALTAADEACQTTGRNQACYGNVLLTAQAIPGAQDFRFETTGDLVAVADLQSLKLSPMNMTTGDWGVALLRLQANLPDTLPGQNVTFLLFGDVELTTAIPTDNPEGLKPMQAFYLHTGAGDALCEEAPESGLLVQTPEGVGSVRFTVNGVDIQMGSTVFFQAPVDQEEMTVSTLEGAAYATADGQTQYIAPGSWARVAMRGRIQPLRSAAGVVEVRTADADAPPEPPRSYQGRIRLIQALPIDLLERPIDVAPPVDAETLRVIQDRAARGGPLCGEAPLPPCERFPMMDDPNLNCVPAPGPLDPPLAPDEIRPLCPPPEAPSFSITPPPALRDPNARPGPLPTAPLGGLFAPPTPTPAPAGLFPPLPTLTPRP